MPLLPANSSGLGDIVSGGTEIDAAPTLVGAAQLATLPTFANGTRGALQIGTRGSLRATLSAPSSADTNATDNADGGNWQLGANRPIGVAPLLFQGVAWDRPRTPAIFKNLSAVVITAETTIWTPAGGKKFRLMGFMLTQGVLTGAITLKDNTAGTTILTIPQTTVGVQFISPPMGNGILSAAANNVLTATGVATETITGFVFGTEE